MEAYFGCFDEGVRKIIDQSLIIIITNYIEFLHIHKITHAQKTFMLKGKERFMKCSIFRNDNLLFGAKQQKM